MRRKTSQTSSISDVGLARALKGLREDVAAPAGFRARVLARLVEEGVLERPAAEAQPGWMARIRQALTPARLALAGAAVAAALIVVSVPRPKAPGQLAPGLRGPAIVEGEKTLPGTSGQALHASGKSAKSQKSMEIAKVVVKAPAIEQQAAPAGMAKAPGKATEEQAEAWQTLETSEQAHAPVLPSAPAASVASAQGALQARPGAAQVAVAGAAEAQAGVAVQTKPIEVVVKPSPTPLARPVTARSEVRQNVARISRGQQALIYVKLEAPGKVRVSVVDRLGRLVAVLKDGDCPSGVSEIRWGGQKDDGSVAAAGVYQVQVRAPGFEDRHKLMLVK